MAHAGALRLRQLHTRLSLAELQASVDACALAGGGVVNLGGATVADDTGADLRLQAPRITLRNAVLELAGQVLVTAAEVSLLGLRLALRFLSPRACMLLAITLQGHVWVMSI